MKIEANPNLYLYKSKFQFSIGAGYRLSTDFSIGKPSDYLIPYKGNTFYFNPINVTFFPMEKWGASASFELAYGQGGMQKQSKLKQYISDFYSKDYYVTFRNDYSFNSLNSFCFMLGIVYRNEFARFKINLGARAGLYSLANYSQDIYLKRKNSNDITNYYIRSKKPSSDCFSVGVSGKIIYALSKNFGLYAEIMPNVTFSNITFIETNVDLNTLEKTQLSVHHNKNAMALNTTFGIVILRNVRR